MIDNMQDKHPTFGDHKLIIFLLQYEKTMVQPIVRRDWRKYSKELLNSKLANVHWDTEIDSVQQLGMYLRKLWYRLLIKLHLWCHLQIILSVRATSQHQSKTS
jgi:hypothetical protein